MVRLGHFGVGYFRKRCIVTGWVPLLNVRKSFSELPRTGHRRSGQRARTTRGWIVSRVVHRLVTISRSAPRSPSVGATIHRGRREYGKHYA